MWNSAWFFLRGGYCASVLRFISATSDPSDNDKARLYLEESSIKIWHFECYFIAYYFSVLADIDQLNGIKFKITHVIQSWIK